MKNRFIPAFIMLLAGLICCLASIIRHLDITYSLVALLLTLLIFYCLGLIAARIIGKVQAQHYAEEKAKAEAEKAAKEAEKVEDEMTATEVQDENSMDGAQ